MNISVCWTPGALELFQTLMRIGPPESLREMAERAIAEEAEGNAKNRYSEQVEVQDVVRACLTETPVPFRPKMLEDLERAGIRPDHFI